MSTESTPSVSMIMPLKTTVLKSVEPNEEDSPTVREVKAAIRENLMGRYSTSCHDFLHKATALDPRFKTLPHVDDACCDTVYNSLITEIVTMEEQVLCSFFFSIKCLKCLICNTCCYCH